MADSRDEAFRVVEQDYDVHLGTEFVEDGTERAVARLEITDRIRQPLGLVHGGVYAALAESVASRNTAIAVWEEGKVAMGMSNQATFLRPATEGTLTAEGRVRHRGRTTWIWDVDIADSGGRLCATVRVTLAVRDKR